MNVKIEIEHRDIALRDLRPGALFAFADDTNREPWMRSDRYEDRSNGRHHACVRIRDGFACDVHGGRAVTPLFGSLSIRSYPIAEGEL